MTRIQRFAAPVLLAALFATLTTTTWRKWPDLLVDFGREMYVPWALAIGKTLYVDVAYFNGPLSPFVNATVFRLFGSSLTTLFWTNLAIVSLLALIIYRFFTSACDRLTGAFVCAAFLTLFAFAQYTEYGSENFVAPYSHDATHGLFLATACVFFLGRYLSERRPATLALSGLSFGLVFLTKAEVLAAVVAPCILGGILATVGDRKKLLHSREGSQVGGYALLLFAASATVPVAAFLLLLCAKMPFKTAVTGLLGTWPAMFGSAQVFGTFQRDMMGLDHPLTNLRITVGAFAVFVLIASGAALLDWSASRAFKQPSRSTRAILAVCAAIGAALIFSPQWFPMEHIGRPLPLIALTTCLVVTFQFVRTAQDENRWQTLAPLAIWSAFSFALLGKMLLNVRISQYGFFLAMPAFSTMVACVLYLIPQWLRPESRERRGSLFRSIALVALVCIIVAHVYESHWWYRLKQLPVGKEGDVILTYGPKVEPRGWAVMRALELIESEFQPDATFAVLPEGAVLNFLSRRMNSTPYIELMPTTLAIFGRQTVLAAFIRAPPDYVILVHKATHDYGVGYFGQDPRYGKQLMDWIESQYAPHKLILNQPLSDGRFGIKILKRLGK